MIEVHPLLRRAFAALDEAGVRWAVLRGEGALGAPDSDVDLLVDGPRLAQAEAALRGTGFVRLPTVWRGSHRFLLGYAAEDDRWIKLDLVTNLDFGPDFALRSGLASGCLARARRVDGVATLGDDDAFWSLLFHAVLDKPSLPADRRRRLAELADAAEVATPWQDVISLACPAGWDRDRILAAVEAGDARSIAALGRAIRGKIGGVGLPGRALTRLRDLVRVPIERLRAFLARPGLAVTLLGPDGSGKSSLAAAVAATFPFPARVLYLGIWKRPAPLRRPWIPGSDLVRRLLFIWRRYLVGRAHRRLRRLVVFDRYTFDVRLGDTASLGWRDRTYVAVLAAACPPPDVALVLDVPAEVAFRRKGERTIDALARDRSGLLALAAESSRFRVVDASTDFEAVRREVTRQIWDAYVARWH